MNLKNVLNYFVQYTEYSILISFITGVPRHKQDRKFQVETSNRVTHLKYIKHML